MKKWLVFYLVLFCWATSTAAADEQSMAVVEAEFWASPRHAEMVLDYAPVVAVVERLLAEPEAYLVLHYPESEAGELWGLELRAWLVSLGIISDRIDLRSGFTASDGVELLIVSANIEAEPALELGLSEAELGSASSENSVDVMGADAAVLEESAQAIDEVEVELELE